jgi:lipopolysaccharide export system protein LptA
VKFLGKVHLQDSTTSVTSRSGYYDLNTKVATFSGGVRLSTDESTIVADTVTHFRDTRRTVAEGSVLLTRNVASDSSAAPTTEVLFADFAESRDSARTSLARGSPVLVKMDNSDTAPDTLVVAASDLYASDSDSLRMLVASDSARLWRDDVAARADTIRYLTRVGESDATGRDSSNVPVDTASVAMTGSPVLWVQHSQITGDRMDLVLTDNRMDSLVVQGNAFVAYRDSAEGHVQQLKARTLVCTFENDTLRTMRLQPNAEARFVTGDETNEDRRGTIRLSGDGITLHFANGELDWISVQQDVEGEYFRDTSEGVANLDGYRWMPGARPVQSELVPPDRWRRVEAARLNSRSAPNTNGGSDNL